ncbi:DUF4376 domain-containing protein [Azorhizophilus paspali]|uniref:DUF4376 domain-containing protein n=1 Tax=Azorhizophilus paspali TaxID=69963 RepID=A0ABV6SFZ6_AZOPA
MPVYAQLDNNAVVVSVSQLHSAVHDPALIEIDTYDQGLLGMHYVDGQFVAPPEPEPEPAPDWPALIATRRYEAETAGTTVDGLPIDTGRDSQALITGAALRATLDSDYTCRWKTVTGFVALTAGQIIGVASAVRAHVQACFDREADLLAALEAGTFDPALLEQGRP